MCKQRRLSLDAETKALFEARAEIIKAMAHPTRLFIVDHLSRGRSCVAELTELIGADMSTVSKHLTVLKAAGIVEDHKQGAQVYYALRVPCVMNFFGCVETVIKSNASRQLQLVK
jgi:ArsR family transcriptional regulator